MNAIEMKRHEIQLMSEKGTIQADEFYYQMGMTHPVGSKERDEYKRKSDWAFEKRAGLTQMSFNDWASQKKS